MKVRIPWQAWLVVVLALGALLVWQLNVLRLDMRDSDRRDQAVDVASAQVLDLTTLDSDSVGTKLKRLTERTSGTFTTEVESITNIFQETVNEKQLDSTGSIDLIGLTSYSDDEATVVVASSANVSEGGAEPVTRTFRMRVKLNWEGGEWKVVGMEFVQ